MTETRNRPGDDSGAAPNTAGETCSKSTRTADIRWLCHRGGDPVVMRRRIAAQLDELLGIDRIRAPVPYAAGGMTLDLAERELAA